MKRQLYFFICICILLSSFAIAKDVVLGSGESKLPSVKLGLTDLYCKLTGCTMKGNINMDNYSIYNANYVNVTYIDVQNITFNETDPIYSAWDKDYNDLINTPAPTPFVNWNETDVIFNKGNFTDDLSVATSIGTTYMDGESLIMEGQYGVSYIKSLGELRLESYGGSNPAKLFLSGDLGGGGNANFYGNSINIPHDNVPLTFGLVKDYSIEFTGSKASHDISNGYYEFTGGNVIIENHLNVTGDVNIKGNFTLDVGVEDDLFFPVSVIKTQGVSNIPEIDLYTLNFDDNTMEQAYLTMQLPHKRKADSMLEPHFHWESEDDTSGDVVWCIEVSRANIGEAFSDLITQCTVSSSVSNSSIHIMSPEIELSGTGMTASAIGKIRIFRNATDTADTYNADAQLIQFDVHYYIDKLGAEP
jgi:hypothetical protein